MPYWQSYAIKYTSEICVILDKYEKVKNSGAKP